MKKKIKSAMWIIFITILILVVIVWFLWIPEIIKHESKMWYKLTEEYLNVWTKYVVWKQVNKINIFNINEEESCLDWSIVWLKILNNDVLFYFDLNNAWPVKTIDKEWDEKILYYNYITFLNTDNLSVKNINDIPKFWYINWDNLQFYAETDLKNLTQEQQKIFKELEQNPTIIINWVDYSK